MFLGPLIIKKLSKTTSSLEMANFTAKMKKCDCSCEDCDVSAMSSREAAELDESLDMGNIHRAVVKTYSGHRGDITCCFFSTDWTMLVTGSDDHTICVWSIRKNTVKFIFKIQCQHLVKTETKERQISR